MERSSRAGDLSMRSDVKQHTNDYRAASDLTYNYCPARADKLARFAKFSCFRQISKSGSHTDRDVRLLARGARKINFLLSLAS